MSGKRKGLVITNLLPNEVERTRGMFVWQETERLRKRYELKAIAPLPWVPSFLRDQQKYGYFAATKCTVLDGFEIHHPRHLVIPGMLRSAYGLLLLAGIRNCFKEMLKKHDPEFIVAHYAFPDGWTALQLARRRNLPVLIKVRGSDVNLFTTSFLRRYLTVTALRSADRVVAVSQALKRKMISLGVPAEHIAVVNNGVNTELFHPRDKAECRLDLGLDPEPFTFLFIGTMREIKGVFNILRAYRAIQVDERVKTRLVMIGDGDLREEVADRIIRFGMTEEVTLHKAIEHKEIPRWIGACDCLLLPSVMEGYPNVLMEALASERPVIASAVGGIPEIVRDGETGILVPPSQPWPLTDAMCRMLRGFEFRSDRAQAAKRGWDDVADDMSGLIEEVLARRAGSGGGAA